VDCIDTLYNIYCLRLNFEHKNAYKVPIKYCMQVLGVAIRYRGDSFIEHKL